MTATDEASQDDQTSGRPKRPVLLVLAVAAVAAIAVLPIALPELLPADAPSPRADGCQVPADDVQSLQAERPSLDEDFAGLLDAWTALDEERSGWEPAEAVRHRLKDRRARDALDSYQGLADDWKQAEAKLETHIQAESAAPETAEWPLDPADHTSTLGHLFRLRVGLNEEWGEIASAMSYTSKRIASLAPDAETRAAFRRRADVYS